MRSLILGLPLLLFLALVQAAALVRVQVLNGGFDIILVMVVAWSLTRRSNDGPLWGLIGGLFADAMSGGPPGAFTLSLTGVALIIALTEGRFYKTNWPVAMIACVLGTVIYHLIYLSVLAADGRPINWSDTLALSVFPSAILNLLLMLPVYQTTKWLSAQVTPPRVEIG